jgi:hypothetical protein
VLGLAAIAPSLSRTSAGGVLLAVLRLCPTVSFLAAPYNSLSAQHAALPPKLRERRGTDHDLDEPDDDHLHDGDNAYHRGHSGVHDVDDAGHRGHSRVHDVDHAVVACGSAESHSSCWRCR